MVGRTGSSAPSWDRSGRFRQDAHMPSYSVNESGVARARELIQGRQYVLESDWGEVQPRADAENSFLESHSWDDYAEWHLGLTDGAADETKARYAFVYGDFRRVHRMGLIRATTGPPSGATRTSSSPHMSCCSCLTAQAPECGTHVWEVGAPSRRESPVGEALLCDACG